MSVRVALHSSNSARSISMASASPSLAASMMCMRVGVNCKACCTMSRNIASLPSADIAGSADHGLVPWAKPAIFWRANASASTCTASAYVGRLRLMVIASAVPIWMIQSLSPPCPVHGRSRSPSIRRTVLGPRPFGYRQYFSIQCALRSPRVSHRLCCIVTIPRDRTVRIEIDVLPRQRFGIESRLR